MSNDIAATIRKTRASYPEGRPKTARDALILVEATRQAAARSRQRIAGLDTKSILSDEPERQRRTLLRELKRLDARLDLYAEALGRVKPSDPPPAEVRPFLRNILWTNDTPSSLRHFTPDFATPFTLDNQAGELGRFGKFQIRTFLRYVRESAAEAQDAAVEAVEDAADLAADTLEGAVDVVSDATGGSVWPWMLGAGVALGIGSVIALRVYVPRL